MAGGLMMALGGALKGYGDATLDQLKEEAKAKREEALANAQFERQRALAADTRQFQSEEAQKQRDFTMGENEKNRIEAEKTRADTQSYRDKSINIQQQELDLKKQGAGELKDTPDGPVRILGSTAEPITDEAGNRIKTLTTAKERPADVVTMEYLIQKGVAKNYDDAWNKVKQGVKADPQPADVEKMVEQATKTETQGQFGLKSEDIQKIRDSNRERIMKNLNVGQQQNQPQSTGNAEKDAYIKQSLDNAKAAIAAGKPRDKVIERLKAAGIDTSGL